MDANKLNQTPGGDANKLVLTTLVGGQSIAVQANSDAQKQPAATTQNTHQQLVHLLKQNAVGQQSQQIRLLASSVASPQVSGATTIQLGNQLITFTAAKPAAPAGTVQTATTQPAQTLQLKVSCSRWIVRSIDALSHTAAASDNSPGRVSSSEIAGACCYAHS